MLVFYNKITFVLKMLRRLTCDAGEHGDPWKVADVAKALGVTPRTIEHLKQRKKPGKVTFDGSFDARLTPLACSDPPEGRKRWTIRLLADKAVELKIADSVSTMTVQRSL